MSVHSFAEAVAHCAEHGLDVAEFREEKAKTYADYADAPVTPWAPYDAPNPRSLAEELAYTYPKQTVTRAEGWACKDCGGGLMDPCRKPAAPDPAIAARAESCERTLAKYSGWTAGDLRAKAEAMAAVTAAAESAMFDAKAAHDEVWAAIRWLEEGKPR